MESSLADSAARFSHGLDQATEGAIPAGLPGGTIHNETGGRVKGEGREEHSCVEGCLRQRAENATFRLPESPRNRARAAAGSYPLSATEKGPSGEAGRVVHTAASLLGHHPRRCVPPKF